MIVARAIPEDAEEILALQRMAFRSQAEIYGDFSIPPLTQTMEQLKGEFAHKVFLKAAVEEQLVGSVRGVQTGQACLVERLIVHPDYRGRGIGTALMRQIEQAFPEARRLELFTGHLSENNLRLYARLGYSEFGRQQVADDLILVFMQKHIE